MSLVNTKYRYSYFEDDTYEDAYVLQVYYWANNIYYDLDDEDGRERLIEKCAKHFYYFHEGYELYDWREEDHTIILYLWVNETTKIPYHVCLIMEPAFEAKRAEDTYED